MIDGGTVLPAESCMKADNFDLNQVQPAVRAYYTSDGVFWPGFVGISEPVLYYNKVHFQKAGLDITKPPQTLAELRTAAEKLKKAGVSKKPLSLILNSWFTESWLNGIGVPTVNHDNGRSGTADKATFDTPQAVKLFTFLKKMKDDGLLDPIPGTDGQINQYLALAQQNSSMTIETSSAATTIKAFLQGDVTASDLNAGSVDVSKNKVVPGAGPFPGIEAPGKVRVSGATVYIVNTNKPEVQAAFVGLPQVHVGEAERRAISHRGVVSAVHQGCVRRPEGPDVLEDRSGRSDAEDRFGPTRCRRSQGAGPDHRRLPGLQEGDSERARRR